MFANNSDDLKVYMKKAFCLCVFLCISAIGSDFEKNYSSAEKHIEKGKFSLAISKLEKLVEDRKISDAERGRAAILLSKAYLGDGKNVLALKVLEKTELGRPDDYYLTLGEAYLVCGNYELASRISSFYNVNENSRLFYIALLTSSKGMLGIRDYLNCIENCRKIIADVPKLYDYEKDDELKKLVSETEDLLKKALELYETERYGLDYVNYRKGREAEETGNFREAIKFYGKINSGTLKDAGRCYTGRCLARLGETQNALNIYSELVEENFTGFYRGEALYETAVLQYLEGDLEKSLKTAGRLNEWLQTVRDGKKETRGINAALTCDVIDAAPKTYLNHDDCGNLIRTKFYPGSINNRATAPWYIPMLSTRAYFLYGFLLGEKGDKAGAIGFFRELSDLDKSVRIITDDETIPSLVYSVENGSYLIPRESLKKVVSKHRNAINLGCFYYLSEDKDRALEMFRRMSENNEIKNRANEMAAVLFGLAHCLISSGKQKDALELLEKLSENQKYRGSAISSYSLFVRACLLSSGAKTRKKAYEFYDRLGSDKKDEFLASRSLLAGAVCAVNGKDKEKAIKYCEAVSRDFGKTPYADAAGTILRAMKEAKDDEIMSVISSEQGRTIKHNVTIIYPGVSDWNLCYSDMNRGDIVFYRIKCIARDGCSIVRSFKMDLTENEPDIPASRGDELVFLRVPVLFMKKFLVSSRIP